MTPSIHPAKPVPDLRPAGWGGSANPNPERRLRHPVLLALLVGAVLVVAGCAARADSHAEPADRRGASGGPSARAAASSLEPAAGNEIAAFGMGCFWGAEVLFGGTEGVVRTSVGFAGGAYENPTYQDIGDHIETVVVEYKPDRVSYADLLELFWNGHDPGRNPWMNQYRSMLFPVTDEQRRAAERSVERHRNQQVGAVLTEVRPIERFYPDRTYHQKYYLRNNARLWNLVVGAYGSERAAERSTVAARANALLARGTTHGTVTAAIDAAVAAGGISPEDAADLKDALSARRE